MDVASVRCPSLLDVLLASSFLTATRRLCSSKMWRALCFCPSAGPMYPWRSQLPAHCPQALLPVCSEPDGPFPEGFRMAAEAECSGVIYCLLAVTRNGQSSAACLSWMPPPPHRENSESGALIPRSPGFSSLSESSLSFTAVLFKPCLCSATRASSSVSVSCLGCEGKGYRRGRIKGSFGVGGPPWDSCSLWGWRERKPPFSSVELGSQPLGVMPKGHCFVFRNREGHTVALWNWLQTIFPLLCWLFLGCSVWFFKSSSSQAQEQRPIRVSRRSL